MNAYAILAVNEHIETLRKEAAHDRNFGEQHPSIRQRVALTFAGLRQTLQVPVDTTGTLVPKLEDYPYRG
jgi:hypothetical protein